MSALYTIVVQGEPKGDIYKHCSRWCWERPNNKGVQKYHRNATLQAVREQVARLCRVPVTDVRLFKRPGTGANYHTPEGPS